MRRESPETPLIELRRRAEITPDLVGLVDEIGVLESRLREALGQDDKRQLGRLLAEYVNTCLQAVLNLDDDRKDFLHRLSEAHVTADFLAPALAGGFGSNTIEAASHVLNMAHGATTSEDIERWFGSPNVEEQRLYRLAWAAGLAAATPPGLTERAGLAYQALLDIWAAVSTPELRSIPLDEVRQIRFGALVGLRS